MSCTESLGIMSTDTEKNERWIELVRNDNHPVFSKIYSTHQLGSCSSTASLKMKIMYQHSFWVNLKSKLDGAV